jgi:2-polyprenyl-6-hydroxyphenyl methylase / 3-demethylubiquinone-9 3-methyltransferase
VDPWREAVWRAVPEGAAPERLAARRAFLLAHVSAGDRVLDVGAGDGTFAEVLVGAGARVAGVDVAEEALRRARLRALGADLRRVAEGAPLPFAEDAFDLVWAGEVLEHVADVVGLLAEVRRVLRWGGTLLATTPHHGRATLAALALRPGRALEEHFDPRADHLRFFTARSLRELVAGAGFSDVDVRASGGMPLLRHALHVRAR